MDGCMNLPAAQSVTAQAAASDVCLRAAVCSVRYKADRLWRAVNTKHTSAKAQPQVVPGCVWMLQHRAACEAPALIQDVEAAYEMLGVAEVHAYYRVRGLCMPAALPSMCSCLMAMKLYTYTHHIHAYMPALSTCRNHIVS